MQRTNLLIYNKKATEKPIEIFVALFIILAVSMVLLKLFNQQISEKSIELKKIQQQAELKQAKGDARLDCNEECSTATQDGCSLRAQARFCLKQARALDLNGDGVTTGHNTDLLATIGICENRINCAQYVECKCGVPLTMIECKKVLCNYWEQLGLTDPQRDTQILKAYEVGTCVIGLPADDRSLMWDRVRFPGGISCT